MSDADLEARLRATLRREAADQPFTITSAELERRLAARRRGRNGQRMTLLAAAVAVVAVGAVVALANGWLRQPSVGQASPPPAASIPPASVAPDASPTPSPSNPPSGGPSGSPGETLPCDIVDDTAQTGPIELIMGATPGDAMAYGGALGAWQVGDQGEGDQHTEIVPDPDRYDAVPATAGQTHLQILAAGPDACITSYDVAARREGLTGSFQPVLGAGEVQPPGRVVDVPAPEAGDWIVRVEVSFQTSGGEDAWTVEFFRVHVAG
jgi:hypothetical protein